MSIFKTDKFYRVDILLGVNDKGKRIRKTKTFKKLSDAKKWESEIIQQYKTGEVIFDNTMLLNDYLDLWFETYVEGSKAYNTQKRYKSLLYPVRDALGHLALNELKTPHTDRLYSDLMKEGRLKNGSILKTHRVFRQAIEQAVAWDMIVKNPVQYAKAPPDDKRDIKTWTIEQVETYFQYVGDYQIRVPALIVYNTGLREGEISALRWDHEVDLENGIFDITKGMIVKKGGILELGPTKTPSSKAKVMLTPTLIAELKKLKLEHKLHKMKTGVEMQWVVGWKDGRPLSPNYISKAFRESVERINKEHKANLPIITFHGLRHTHASILYSVGASSHEISKRLRHSRVSTTDDIYIHLSDEAKKQTADIFEKATKKATQ